MVFSLYNLFEATLLCVNAIAVLHEERFLAKVGWGRDQSRGFGEEPGVKGQLMNLIHSVRTVMRNFAKIGFVCIIVYSHQGWHFVPKKVIQLNEI
nr:immediate early response 3-interacting protein 1 isoform X1 [Parasteatoda tepidariorum]